MTWRSVPIVGVTAVLVALLVAAAGLAVFLVAERRGRSGRTAGLVVTVVGVLAALGVAVNSALGAYPTVGALLPPPDPPLVSALPATGAHELDQGAEARIPVPDNASHFGRYDAEVWLPPQYFSEPARRFPLLVLAHGNPGRSPDWLRYGSAAETGLESARAGHPVILVMPTVLQQPDGDSLCVDTASQGNAATYVVDDVVVAADTQLRTLPGAAHHAIGGFSMGGFCALNLGLKHPDVFSVVLAFSALTECEPDAIAGGNQALFGGPDWQARTLENSPADYYQDLDPGRGPALWLDAGADEELAAPLGTFAGRLRERGFTAEYHERPGGHDFETWTGALNASLPWAAARLG